MITGIVQSVHLAAKAVNVREQMEHVQTAVFLVILVSVVMKYVQSIVQSVIGSIRHIAILVKLDFMATVAKRPAVKTAKHKMKSTNVTKTMDHACMVVQMATGLKLALKLAQKDVLIIICAMRQMEFVYMVAFRTTKGNYV